MSNENHKIWSTSQEKNIYILQAVTRNSKIIVINILIQLVKLDAGFCNSFWDIESEDYLRYSESHKHTSLRFILCFHREKICVIDYCYRFSAALYLITVKRYR